MSPSLKALLEKRWKKRNTQTPYVFEFQEKELRDVMARLCGVAKVRGFTFHSIRHHVLSLLNDTGKLSLKQVQLYARHRRQSTTENYLQDTRGLEEAAAILEKCTARTADGDRKQVEGTSAKVLNWRRDRDSNPR